LALATKSLLAAPLLAKAAEPTMKSDRPEVAAHNDRLLLL
jgi:hypothetical protein